MLKQTMEKELETYLEILNSERCLKKPKEIIIILNKITKLFDEEMSQSTIGLLLNLLLSETNALFSFLRKMSFQKGNISAVTTAFRLLEHLVTNLTKPTEPYFSFLYQKCLSFLNAKLAKVKEESLKLIRNILNKDFRQLLDLTTLVTTLAKYLANETKIPGTVLEQMYSLLGYLFEKHPESLIKEKWFLKQMLKTLQLESAAGKNANISAVKGAFEGVNSYLTSYPPLNAETMKKIYEYVKNWSKFWEEKKPASRAGLKILQNHWSRFYKLMYNDREFWKINMEIWVKEKKEDRDVGFKFLCAFYSVIALFIKQDANGSGVQEYLKEFTRTLDSDTNSHEKKAALVGIKLLVLTGSVTETDLIATYELVFDFVQREETKKFVYCLPYSVECVSALVLKSASENRTEMLSFLQSLSIKLINMYPDFELELQNHAVVALEKSFYMLGLTDLEIMEIHIERVLYLGLIQSCSIISHSELELLKETEQITATTSSDSYLSLWKYLLTLARSSNLPVGGSFQLKKGIAVEVFDVFVRSFLRIISKLNFHVNEEMELENPSDVHIFINIVTLYEDLVHEVDSFHLEKWLMEILKTAINLSNANPLVSGFYKIITASLQVANSLEFDFNSVGFLRTFVEQVLVKVNLFKGDLQMSCLKVVLASPVHVIEGFAENTIPALEMAVQLARNSWELLNDLIETLQRWDSCLPSSYKVMEKILPHFDLLFQSFYFKNNSNSVAEWSKSGGRVINDSEFLALQKKFLMFLGNMEMRKGLNMIELPEAEERVISDKPLIILLPYNYIDVPLDLEEITLRAASLAESCGDRKTRLVACELLHFLFIVIIGNVNQLAGTYKFLFKKVFSCCLNLGCDSDNAVCQIFEPLMYQVMHYFSGKKALHFSETSDLIDILFERLTCPFNQTVRDFASLLLREFTIWTMKQLTPEELKTTPESVKRILEKMYSLALHPSFNKRLGAAVLFNKIYSILREEDYILNAYWFELFYYFMESLRMCDGLEDVTEIINAIRHVERPLVENSKQFNEASPHRIVPPDFKGGRLCHLVYWAMERGCDTKLATRRTAMQSVEILAPLVEYCDTNMSFVSKQLQNFFHVKEISFESHFNEEECVNWLKYHNAGFEYCTWLLNQNVLTTEEVLQPKFKASLKRFINGMLSLKTSTPCIDTFQRECILSYLHLLYALRERAILFPSEHWNLLRKTVFKPSSLGFDLNRSSVTDTLSAILVPFITYLSEHLTSYDWVNFYTNLEAVVVAPVFKEIVSNQTLSVKNLEFLFTLKVVERSGIWNDFVERVLFIVEESLLLYLIFSSLFIQNGNKIQAAAIDPTRRFYLEELLKIVLKVNSDFSSVVNCLENEEEVLVEETGKTVRKGEYFQMIFKTTLLEYLKCNFSSLLDWIKTQTDLKGVKLLFFILKNYSEGFDCLDLFGQWNEFKKLNLSDRTLLQLFALGARHVGTPGFLKCSPIADKIYEILKSQNLHELNLTDIKLVFSILPFVSEFGEGVEENKKLADCLANMHVDVDSLGRIKTTSGKSHYQLALTGFLRSLKTTGSLVFLKFILESSVWFSVVCVKEEIESSLSVFGEARVPKNHVIAALELVYQYCFEKEKSDSILTVYKLFLTPLMKVAPSEAVQYLIESKMVSLCDLMTTNWGDGESLMEVSVNMMKKLCCAGVFQTFVAKVPREDIDRMTKESRQSMVMMVRKVFSLLKTPYPPSQLRELHRKLMCEIFNMICCIVSSRCTKEKFYKLFVFDERGSFLFETIDKSFKYDFRMDFDEIPKRKKHVTVLRETVSEDNTEQISVKYIQTNTLFSSSLREDVTWFDLTHSFIRPTNSVKETTRNVEIELEMDSLNDHECMATLVATILKLVRDKITPVDDASNLPCWLNFFVSILKNPRLCHNLKLLVLKAIYNVQQFVVPFCEEVLSDLLYAILKGFVNYPINYFLLDLIEMMIGWECVPEKEKSRLLLTELVEFVMSKSDSIRRDVFKQNLEVLKKMVECWKSALIGWNLSKFAYDRLCKSIKEDFESGSAAYFNLHICGVLLSNDIPAWTSELAFFRTVTDAFREDYRNNELLAEVCGLGLKHLEKINSKNLHSMEELVREKISTLKHFWFNILYGIHKHYPRISIPFTFKIFSSAWDSNHSLTVKKLEMLLSHVSESGFEIDTTFCRHAGPFLLDMLNSSDVAVHEISLQIAEKLLDKLDTDKLKVFVLEVVRLQRSSSPGVRKWVYEICKKLYSSGSPGVVEDCKIILLRGLNDSVDELVKSCLEFWKEVSNYTSPSEALLQIFQKMYSSETEEIFLGNAAKMLVHFADGFLSSRILFPHPIASGCNFSNRNITLGSRQSLLLPSSNKTLTYLPLEYVATVRQHIVHQRSANTLRFEPTVVKNSQELIPGVSQPPPTTLVPNNPLKRRFYKKESEATWRKKKPEEIKKTQAGLKIYGEYRDGDYPDIQIRNSQILELLEVLCKRDQQTAKFFLISFYSGVFQLLKLEEKNDFLSKTKTLFENILKTSSSFDSCVFSFFLRVILNHKLDLDCQLISKAAVSSNCISLGALVLEQVISDREGENEFLSKKRNYCESTEENRWLELARLYRTLKEFDVSSGIFLDKLKLVGDARKAVWFESVSNWQDASKCYESVLRTKPDSCGKEFYTESYLTCLARLSDWSSLNKCIRTSVNHNVNELWSNYNLLSWFLKSEIMISLGTDREEFKTILEGFCENKTQEYILSTHFGEEMFMFDWFSKNLPKANHRIDRLCSDFLAEWSHLDQWSYNLRASKLQKLQLLAELNFGIRNHSEGSRTQLEQNIKSGLKLWEMNLPLPGDDLTVWDVKLACRREFLKHLESFDLSGIEVRCYLALAKAALAQENLNMVKGCLSKVKDKFPDGDFDLKIERDVCFNVGKMILARKTMENQNVGWDMYLNVWKGISEQISSLETCSNNTFLYSCNFTLGQLMADILHFLKKKPVPPDVLTFLCSELMSTKSGLSKALETKGLEYFEKAKSLIENSENCSPGIKSKTYLELAKFFLKFPSLEGFEKLAKYLLKSMCLGSPEARELFGCVLNFLPPEDHSFDDIIHESESVPSWMFIMWINQILALSNSTLAPFLKTILLRLIEDYPNSIRYALKLRREVEPNHAAEYFLEKLYFVSPNPIYDDFCSSIKYLASPQMIMRHYLDVVSQEAALPQPDFCLIRKVLTELKDLMFSPEHGRFRGPVFQVWDNFKPSIEELIQVNDLEALKQLLSDILSRVESSKTPSKASLMLLESYSPWLHSFHALKSDTELEIPGQYDGTHQPIKKYLVMAMSFRNTILQFDSKCKPIRISILGNDAKNYKFLVKFGEDLRQDERIQQVFQHFNHRLKESYRSRFFIDTYKVIPVSLNLGMIQWVEDTVSLYDLLVSSLGNNTDAIAKAQVSHLSFFSNDVSPTDAVAVHLAAFENVTREKAILNFKMRVKEFSENLLKNSFLRLSTSPEHFFHLRGNFASSHAVMSVTHWLVGIGDRHLQNTLVSVKTGRVLGIDFGYAFGFATQFITPPDLLPFRLTPQILNLMHPLDESGWIKQTMIHCLRIYRKESFRLRSVLEVFVREPVMNWLTQVKSRQANTWSPREKVELVERKLSGTNPVLIFEADLHAGHSESKLLPKYMEVLQGSPDHNIRTKFREDGLTEEDQVDCLIDLATDCHVLSKTYVGWNPWL